MAYTVRKLLESEQFPKMKLLCGEKGLDLEVKGIRIIEIEDMERYLTGGEILITSFQVYLSCNDREVEQHFEDLVKSDISGFIVKKRKEYDPTGRRLSLLEKHCKKYEIPLVEISEDFYYWGIIRHVMIQVFDKDTARLKYFKITHDNFNTFILKNNGSSNTASDIIRFLSIMIENPVVLYYGNLNCMVSTNSDNSKLILSDEIQPYKPNIITKFQYMKQMKGSCVQYVVKFAIWSEVEIYITITEENRGLTELDYMAIENAIINLQYGFLSEFAQDEVKKKYQRDLIHNILNGLLSSKEMTEAAAQLGMKESDTYRVVDFHTIKNNVRFRLAGSMAVEDEGTKIVVYDYDGNQLLKLGGEDISSPDKLGSITGMAETENGFVAADGNMREIQFWAKDGTHVGAISTEDIFGVSYPWLEDMQLLDDGSLLIMLTQERDDGSANELMFFRLTGF